VQLVRPVLQVVPGRLALQERLAPQDQLDLRVLQELLELQAPLVLLA
jgi:hypothetical protein